MSAKPKKVVVHHFNDNARDSIKTVPQGPFTVHVITPSSAKSMALLESAYTEVYLPCFTKVDEQVSLADLKEQIKEGVASVTIIGDGFGTPKPAIKAVAIAYKYSDDKRKQMVGLLGYIGTRPGERGQGIGHAMYDAYRAQLVREAKKKGHKLTAFLHECNPVGTQNDVMDPATRIAMYEKWGCLQLPLFYKQPPLSAGQDGIELVLMVEPHPETGKYPTKDDIRAFLYGIYKESEKNAKSPPPEKNPDYIRSLTELAALDLDKVYKNTKAPPKTPKGPKPS